MIKEQLFREALQEGEYQKNGAYHRDALGILPTSNNIRYHFARSLLPKRLNGQNCLDFGGGDGVMASFMADRGANVVVFDPSLTALEYAAKGDRRLKTVQGQTVLPFNDKYFKAVTMLETLEHIRDGEEMIALKEAFRVLDDNGLFVISVPSDNRPVALKHYRHYSLDDLSAKLRDAGFTITSTIGYKGYLESLRKFPRLIRRTIKGVVYGTDFIVGGFKVNMELAKCKEKDAMGFVVLAKKINAA